MLVHTEHNVHVLESLAYGSLQQIVYYGSDYYLLPEDINMDEGLIRIDHLLEVKRLV